MSTSLSADRWLGCRRGYPAAFRTSRQASTAHSAQYLPHRQRRPSRHRQGLLSRHGPDFCQDPGRIRRCDPHRSERPSCLTGDRVGWTHSPRDSDHGGEGEVFRDEHARGVALPRPHGHHGHLLQHGRAASPGIQAACCRQPRGLFLTAQKDFSKDAREQTVFNRYINRWHLEKQDNSLSMSPPKEPIVIYIEKTVPVKYRRWIKEGIEDWNKAFENVGIIGAIEVLASKRTRTSSRITTRRTRGTTSSGGSRPSAPLPSRLHARTRAPARCWIRTSCLTRRWFGTSSMSSACSPTRRRTPRPCRRACAMAGPQPVGASGLEEPAGRLQPADPE
jgi:hypothetical protein